MEQDQLWGLRAPTVANGGVIGMEADDSKAAPEHRDVDHAGCDSPCHAPPAMSISTA